LSDNKTKNMLLHEIKFQIINFLGEAKRIKQDKKHIY
jgi:hypothetical protein